MSELLDIEDFRMSDMFIFKRGVRTNAKPTIVRRASVNGKPPTSLMYWYGVLMVGVLVGEW